MCFRVLEGCLPCGTFALEPQSLVRSEVRMQTAIGLSASASPIVPKCLSPHDTDLQTHKLEVRSPHDTLQTLQNSDDMTPQPQLRFLCLSPKLPPRYGTSD